MLGALGVIVLALIAGDGRDRPDQSLAVVLATTASNWFGPGADVDAELRAMRESAPLPGHGILYFTAWPLIWGTLLTTVGAVVLALFISTFAAVFLTEFAPPRACAVRWTR